MTGNVRALLVMPLVAASWFSVSCPAQAANQGNSSPFSSSLVQTIHQVVDLIPLVVQGGSRQDMKHLNQALMQLLLVLERQPNAGPSFATDMNGMTKVSQAKGQSRNATGNQPLAANAQGVVPIGGMVGQNSGKGNKGAGTPGKGKDCLANAAAGQAVGGMVGQKICQAKGANNAQGQAGVAAVSSTGKSANGAKGKNTGTAMAKNNRGNGGQPGLAQAQSPQLAAGGAFVRGMGQVHPQAHKGKKK
jgi:hypothetical protein